MIMVFERADIERACAEYANKHFVPKDHKATYMGTNVQVSLGNVTVNLSFEKKKDRTKRKTK